MRTRVRREDVVNLARFAFLFEAGALVAALVLGSIHALLTRGPFFESFYLMTFVVFLLILLYAVLSGPGMNLSRPKLTAFGDEGRRRWRRSLATPQVGRDREFFELVLFTGLAFLLLVIVTGIGEVVRLLGG